MSDVLDLMPRLRKSQQDKCGHQRVTVHPTAAQLTCDDCELEIDPWWYIRAVADSFIDIDKRRDATEASITALLEEGNAKIDKLNETIMRLNGEVTRLTGVYNKLYNQQTPDGRLLGGAARARTRSKR